MPQRSNDAIVNHCAGLPSLLSNNVRMPGFTSAPLRVSSAPPHAVDADLLVVPTFESDNLQDVDGLDTASGGEWARAVAAGELTGKPFETLLVPLGSGWRAGRVLFVGAGPASRFTHEMAGRLGAAAALHARQHRTARVAMLVRSVGPSGISLGRLVQSVAEGLVLGQLDPAVHKTGERDSFVLTRVEIVLESAADVDASLKDAAHRGCVLGECANDARRLANEPSNVLTPRVFAERAAALAQQAGLVVEILDENRIAQLGMGLLLGVAKGSAEPPRLIVLRHEPANARPDITLGFVGKGITFDTGGISIKPAEGMERMKVDMGGGAAVIAALCAIARLRVPLRAVAIVPCTENMPGGRAIKPGDIVRSASGKTVEVVNTDAEGRLVLADGLWYAQQLGATHLVDVATLTGACVVALGRWATGLFARPDPWVDAVRQAADRASERAWPMPLHDEYFEQLKSEWADMSNTGGRPAGAVTAAVFLKQFAGDLPWAHLDIAGTVWIDDPRPWQSKGATGTAVRTLAELALSHPEWART
jgi:leucyl aminopeptidase